VVVAAVTLARRYASMTLRTHTKLAEIGFSLMFGSVFGSIVILSMPFFQSYESAILWFIALPAFLTGAGVTII
jgi:hypothetical protein